MADLQSSISIDYTNDASRRDKDNATASIVELDGKRRQIILRGSNMPLRGVQFGMTQRIINSWPAGSQTATQQVLGATQNETAMNGQWKRNWLGTTPVTVIEEGREIQIVYPRTLRDLFFDVLKQGSLLRFTWGSISRTGRLSVFNCPHDREDDIDWQATFQWVSSGPSFPKRLVSTRKQGVKSEVDGLLLLTESLAQYEATEIPVTLRPPTVEGAPSLTVGQASAFLDAPRAVVEAFGRNVRELANNVAEVADLVPQARRAPIEVHNSLLATAENIVAQCTQFSDEMSRQPPEQATYDRRVTSLYKTSQYYDGALTQSEYIARTAAELRNKERRQADREDIRSDGLLALHLVKQGDTLGSISLAYYGTPDEAYTIAKANRLTYPVEVVTTASGRPAIGGKTILAIPRISR
jgi:hypothetical protein